MRAVVCTRYGPPEVLELREVAAPVPRRDEVLVAIRAATVSASDCFVRSAVPSASLPIRILLRLAVGITRPRRAILGMVLAGEIAKVGPSVRSFRAGERVVAFTKLRFGAYAERACVRESSMLVRAPANLSDEEAAALPYGGLLALFFLRKGGIASGQKVLIYGASGAIGTSAVQLARHFGAAVTAVCGPTNADLARSLGAETVLDYTTERRVDARFDLVLDAVGRRKTSPFKDACRQALAPGGRHVSVDDGNAKLGVRDLALLVELAEAGRLKPVIDRRYPLEEIVEAHRYAEAGHARGTIIVSVGAGDSIASSSFRA